MRFRTGKRMAAGLVVAGLAAMPFLAAASSGEALSEDARRVVGYLVENWEKRFHSTSIALAFQNLGMKGDDGLRLEIGQHFRDHPDLAKNLQYWGANNYLLSNLEKRIAKQLVNTHRDEQRFPEVAELAKVLQVSEEQARGRLAFLHRAGFLEGSPADGYTLVSNHQTWGGPLRYNFHTIHVEGEESFDVW